MPCFQALDSHFFEIHFLVSSISCNNLSTTDKNHTRVCISLSYFNQVFSTAKSDLVLAVDREESIVDCFRLSIQASVCS
jgi:hypothetical protein